MSDKRKIRIFHTNDLHSNVKMMPKIAHFFKQKRMEGLHDDEVNLFIDLGDHMDRMYMGTEVSRGYMNREILEASGYQIVTFGNNEGITLTKQEIREMYRGTNLNIVLSNIIDAEDGERPDWLLPYKIITTDTGFRLGFFGLTVPFTDYYSLLGWQVAELDVILGEMVNTLSGKVDCLILLSHLGITRDRLIAENYPNIDLILGAHSHHLIPEGEWVNQTLISQMGYFGYHVGEVKIQFDENHQITSLNAGAHSIENEEEDPKIVAIIEKYEKLAKNILNEPVIHLRDSLELSLASESNFANLLAQSIRNWTQTDISLVNSGCLLYPLHEGPVTREDLLNVCPHPINPCKITLSGAKLRRILEEGLLEIKMGQRIKGYGFRGQFLGFPAVDGCEIIYGQEEQITIHEIRIAGRRIDWTDMIEVGTVDMFIFMKPYKGLEEVEDVQFFLPEFLRDILYYELHRKGALQESYKHRFHLWNR